MPDADFDVRGHRKTRVDGGLPQRPELRLAVKLAGLQRDADLDDARVAAPFLDLAQRAGDVVGIHPDGAAESVTELVVLEPARHHHLVVRGVQRAAQMPVRHDAAAHRVQDRHIDTALRKQFVGQRISGSEPGILTVRPLGVRGVLAARRAVPVHLVVGESAALERLAQEVPQVPVGREEDVHARVDDAACVSRQRVRSRSHPSAPVARAGPTRLI